MLPSINTVSLLHSESFNLGLRQKDSAQSFFEKSRVVPVVW